MRPPEHVLDGLQVWDRGWLSSTQVLVMPAAGEAGALLFDAAHALHGEQTLALLRRSLGELPLRAVVNTHLHSDHCGGNALLQQTLGAEAWVPPGQAAQARAWQDLSHQRVGQHLPRFRVDRVLALDEALRAGGREWQPLRAPGHDAHALMFWDADHRVLIAGDALWEQGFGVVFPELWGERAFEDAMQVLDDIERLRLRALVPGHGAVCRDVPAALAQARRKLQAWNADPRSHARYAAKVLIKYHLMEVRQQALSELLDWGEGLWLLGQLWPRLDPRPAPSLRDWLQQTVAQLVQQGALRADGAVVLDAA
ncbi:MAG: MBL fold metallo-hydrolase [Burkholderiales bacterium]|nr:MBL fold metallo-hydrolase [Burkholderiales bacterium]